LTGFRPSPEGREARQYLVGKALHRGDSAGRLARHDHHHGKMTALVFSF